MFPAIDRLVYAAPWSKKHEDGNEEGEFGAGRFIDYNHIPEATMDGDDDDSDDYSSYDYAPAA